MSKQPIIHNIDYSKHVELVGTAHFTKRSLNDVHNTVKNRKPKDIAIELDWTRFNLLNNACVRCPRRGFCYEKCEFVGATEALGNVDANIWLIDMSEKEIQERIRYHLTFKELIQPRQQIIFRLPENPIWLWEHGYKNHVIENSKKRIEILRRYQPSVWKVLIDERNALMAARLAWIIQQNFNKDKDSKILAFVGAAHVEDVKKLLQEPKTIEEQLNYFNLPYTPPFQVKRVQVAAS